MKNTKSVSDFLKVALPLYLIFASLHCFLIPGGVFEGGLLDDLIGAFIILILPYILLVIIFSLFKSLFNLKFLLSYSNWFFVFSLVSEFLIIFGMLY